MEEIEEELVLSIAAFSLLPQITIRETWEKLLTTFKLPPKSIFQEIEKKRQYYFSLGTDQYIILSGVDPERPMYNVMKAMISCSLVNLRSAEIQLVHLHLMCESAMLVGTPSELSLFAKIIFKLNVLIHTELFHISKQRKKSIPYPESPPAVATFKATAIYIMEQFNELAFVIRTDFLYQPGETRKNKNFDSDFIKLGWMMIKSINVCVSTTQ